MIKPLLLIIIFYLSSNLFGQNIYNHVPSKVDTSKKYLFYLHGRIIEEYGVRPESKKYGIYEYEKILNSLAETGFEVISEPRPKNTDIFNYSQKVAAQIDSLLASGVPPGNITVIGASKGAGIAVLVSNTLKNDKIKYVIMAICNRHMAKFWKDNKIKLWGKVLYIYDINDEIAGSCKGYLDILRSDGLKEYKEIEVKLGLGHGILYSPFKEWVTPALEWANQ
ncbi:hypothetical protein MNBD_IGNAVI01-766 [hydrothermal vent metagenome]|uniref:Alpha/beta hydrolase n=1 Tax=hydrothermal vent metagenome TaxID=652676 RepID=A0A3B1C8S5_9ZZZZ